MIYNRVSRISKELIVVHIDTMAIVFPFVKVSADEFRQRL